ncbi:cell division protein FtsW [Candidatus Dojkabacteria bacterium]|nr:cell division protein FtsW [Candidatus Dojkabacteria bacterium]
MPFWKSSEKVSKKNSKKRQPDYILLTIVGIFLTFGLIMLFEASIYRAEEYFHDKFYFVKQQFLWIVLGVGAGCIFYLWDYRKLSKLVIPAMIANVVLLIAVLIFGTEINGSKRWFYVGPIPVQPAEFIKPIFILYLCSWLSKEKKTYKTFKEAIRYHFIYELGSFLALLGFIGGLVILEPDLGTTIVIGVTAFIIYFTSGKDYIHSLGSILIVIVGGILGLAAALLAPYRLDRIRTFVQLLQTGKVTDPTGSGYQMQQILIGIGSGGFWGKGFGQSGQRWGYLVEITAFTDSIFAIILEELGMIGGVVLIMLFLIFLARAYRIAMNAPDRLGQLLAGGIGFWLVFQAFMHMGANVALIPLTGVPLPFFTYGGSSTLVTLAAIGILLNISKYSAEN